MGGESEVVGLIRPVCQEAVKRMAPGEMNLFDAIWKSMEGTLSFYARKTPSMRGPAVSMRWRPDLGVAGEEVGAASLITPNILFVVASAFYTTFSIVSSNKEVKASQIRRILKEAINKFWPKDDVDEKRKVEQCLCPLVEMEFAKIEQTLREKSASLREFQLRKLDLSNSRLSEIFNDPASHGMLLLRHVLLNNKIHWSYGFVLFRAWRRDRQRVSEFRRLFGKTASEVNRRLKQEGFEFRIRSQSKERGVWEFKDFDETRYEGDLINMRKSYTEALKLGDSGETGEAYKVLKPFLRTQVFFPQADVLMARCCIMEKDLSQISALFSRLQEAKMLLWQGYWALMENISRGIGKQPSYASQIAGEWGGARKSYNLLLEKYPQLEQLRAKEEDAERDIEKVINLTARLRKATSQKTGYSDYKELSRLKHVRGCVKKVVTKISKAIRIQEHPRTSIGDLMEDAHGLLIDILREENVEEWGPLMFERLEMRLTEELRGKYDLFGKQVDLPDSMR